MVDRSPELILRMENTAFLINTGRADLIPPLSPLFLDLSTYNKLNQIKPWIEPRDISGNPFPGTDLINPQIQETQPNKNFILPIKPISYIGPPVNDRILILCVDFIDRPNQTPISSIQDRFFSTTANIGRTFINYYSENSYNIFIPQGEIHGWYRAPNPSIFYTNNNTGFGSYPNNVQKLYEDVLDIAFNDPDINWNNIDANNDNIIDHVFILHSGAEAASTGNLNDFWAVVWGIQPKRGIGKTFSSFAVSAEYISTPGEIPRTGVDCHEFGHLLGLPDLYDYTGNSNGAGSWSLMASGSWQDSGFTPVHLDAWSKYVIGWAQNLRNPSGTINLQSSEVSPVQIHLSTQDPNQLFVIENRQKILFDEFLPGDGILIWRINKAQQNNSNLSCYRVGLVEADGREDLVRKINTGDSSDTFPGLFNIRSIGANTTPSSLKLCDGTKIDIFITNISNSGPIMNLDIVPFIKVGDISFTSFPPGAEIFLDGIDKSIRTPNTLRDISIGIHSYLLRLHGFEDVTDTINVLENTTVSISKILIPITKTGNILFTSSPPEAEIILDGTDKLIKTPNVLQGIPIGIHSYVLKLPNFDDATGEIDVLENQTISVSRTLTRTLVQAGFGDIIGIILISGLILGYIYSTERKKLR